MMPTERQFIKKNVYRALSLGYKIKDIFSFSDRGESYRVREFEDFDEGFNKFWDYIKDDFIFIKKKSRHYLNWRYSDARGGDYRRFMVEEDGAVLGYIVLRINKFNEDYHVGFIVDLLTLAGHHDVENALLVSVLQFFHDEGVNIIQSIVAKDSRMHDSLKRFDFIDSRSKSRIDYMTYGVGDYSNLLPATGSNLHFTFGDVDTI